MGLSDVDSSEVKRTKGKFRAVGINVGKDLYIMIYSPGVK